MEWRWGDGIKRISKQNPKMFKCKHGQVLVVNLMWEVRAWEPSWMIRRFPAQAVHYGIEPSLRRNPRRWKWWQWFQLWASEIWGAQAISPEPLGLQFWCSARKSWLLSWPLRYPLEAEALALMATVLQPFLSLHWCLQKAPYLPPVSLLVSPCSSLYLRSADMDGISLSCSHFFCLWVWCHPYFQWEGPNEAFKFTGLVTDFPFSSSRAQTCIHPTFTELCSMPCFVLEMRYTEMQKHGFCPQGACYEETDIYNYNVIQWLGWPVYG